MSGACGCCACLAGAGARIGIENRPGLSALEYRIGTYGSFYEAMIRRLTVPMSGETPYSLHALTTRESDDPSIALLDAWAVVGDVLTFYQERIANEGYLRTATERRSILELGRLVGYKLKPGVSASVYLAYTVDDTAKTIIPAHAKAQSIPGANEQPQTFETQEDLEARGAWNVLKPRLSRPQLITLENVLRINSVWIEGTDTRIDAGENLLFVFQWLGEEYHALRRALKTNVDTERKRTEVVLDPVRPYYLDVADAARKHLLAPPDPVESVPFEAAAPAPKRSRRRKKADVEEAPQNEDFLEQVDPNQLTKNLFRRVLLALPRSGLQARSNGLPSAVRTAVDALDRDFDAVPPPLDWSAGELVQRLSARAALAPKSQWQMGRTLNASFSRNSDYLPRLLNSFIPQMGNRLYGALAAATTGKRPQAEFRSLHVLRRRAAPFGYNAPPVLFEDRPGTNPPAVPSGPAEDGKVLYLDSPAESIKSGSYVVFRQPGDAFVRVAQEVDHLSRAGYGLTAKTTRLGLNEAWAGLASIAATNPDLTAAKANLAILRSTSVLTQSEQLPLAQMPVDTPIGGPAAIELDTVVDGLQPGRWVIVSGERIDTSGTSGIIDAELAMVDGLELVTETTPGATPYTKLSLAPEGLRFQYKRATVKIYGNVVKADHGETRAEILGGGNAAQPLQTFTLRQTPLTFVSAPTPAGVVSTLAIRVNDVLWHETDTFAGTSPDERVFVTKIANDGKVSVTFGNGREGARVPTGNDNVRALYRTGIGRAGNVRARQIATAISRPLGVKDVINPIAASGGADPESRDDARRNIPVSLQAMGRVVSVQDYADFARTFAGISKASAIAISDGRARIVHLTVGGAGDIEIDVHSDLYRNLVEALRVFGDPYQPFVVAPREKLVVAGSANVRIHPDYLWTSVAPVIRAKLLDVFSYDRRDFGQVLFPAEVIAAIQSVPGVTYVDLDALGGIAQTDIVDVNAATGPGKIAGTVADGNNVGLPGVTVTATNIRTAQQTTVITNADGKYSMNVPRGEYRIEVTLAGFQTIRRTGVVVRASATTTEDFRLSATVADEVSASSGTLADGFNAPQIAGVKAIVPKHARLEGGELLPAQIAYIAPELADLFILTEIPNE